MNPIWGILPELEAGRELNSGIPHFVDKILLFWISENNENIRYLTVMVVYVQSSEIEC